MEKVLVEELVGVEVPALAGVLALVLGLVLVLELEQATEKEQRVELHLLWVKTYHRLCGAATRQALITRQAPAPCLPQKAVLPPAQE